MTRAKTASTLRVLFLAAEAAPFIKVGGLGDVAGALPAALRRIAPASPYNLGPETGANKPAVDIRLVLPFYPALSKAICNLRPIMTFNLETPTENLPVEAFDCELDGVPVYLISGAPLNLEGPVYTGDPLVDGRKFIFFSLAALEMARAIGWQPDIVHANDWHTAPALYALKTRYADDPFFSGAARLIGIHNLPYLGVGTGPVMEAFGLQPAKDSPLPWWAQELPLPTGLLAAEQIVAVSPTYAREILTPEFGSGLDEYLNTRKESVSGILNGLDVDRWNPATDPAIHTRFESESLPERSLNKQALQSELGLPAEPQVPLLAMITRLDNQKGVDLAVTALRQMASEDEPAWQAVLLGSGLPELERACRQLEEDFPGRVRAVLAFDEPLSHRIYSGADMLLIPSRYEPCGLAQMIAMRYGCIPVARATGGLKDSILDYTPTRRGTGFLFEEASAQALAEAVRRALLVYKDQRRWQAVQRQAMRQDFSWERSAQKYLELYLKMARQG